MTESHRPLEDAERIEAAHQRSAEYDEDTPPQLVRAPSQAAMRRRMGEIASRTTGQRMDPMAEVELGQKRVGLDDARAVLQMKKTLGYAAFIAVAAQLLIADVVFVCYAIAVGGQIPPEVMIGWLSATVVQVVGVVLVIARHLFPTRSDG